MSSSSAAPVLDPLGAPEATFLDAGVSSVATVPRSERIAPDVTAMHGVEAVAIVRAGGFIAAIESVASDLAEGTVIEQEPQAGERLDREGVITLPLTRPVKNLHLAVAEWDDELMTNLSPAEQALQNRINASVAYARELQSLDGRTAKKLLGVRPGIDDLRDRSNELAAIALATNCRDYVDAAMRRARGAVEDAAGLRLVAEGEAREDMPTFWGLDSEAFARLVVAVMLRAGSIVLGRA